MKVSAIILATCMLLLNAGDLLGNLIVPMENTEMCCCADSDSSCCSPEEDPDNSKKSCDTEQECPPACDCSIQFQITAIAYKFVDFTGTVVQSYHYGLYANRYSFEYIHSFLQPPRFG